MKSKKNRSYLTHFSLALLVASCTLSYDEDHRKAELNAPSPIATADGTSQIDIEITGEDQHLLVSVEGAGAQILRPDGASSTTDRPVYLEDGRATVSVVSTKAGSVIVHVEANEVRSEIQIEFEPVRLGAGAPTPQEVEAAKVVHKLCIAASTQHGSIRAPTAQGVSPATVPLSPDLPPGSDCPGTLPGNVECHADAECGYALFEWRSASGSDTLVFGYGNPSAASTGAADFSLNTSIEGASFPGYTVSSSVVPDSGEGLLAVTLTLAFDELPTLASAAATNTMVPLSFPLSAQAPNLIAVSSGTTDAPTTNSEGKVTLYYSAQGTSGIHALFATPTDGVTRFVADLDFGPSI